MNNEQIYKSIINEIENTIKKQKIAIEIRKLYANIPNEQLIKLVNDFLCNLSTLDEINFINNNEKHIPRID